MYVYLVAYIKSHIGLSMVSGLPSYQSFYLYFYVYTYLLMVIIFYWKKNKGKKNTIYYGRGKVFLESIEFLEHLIGLGITIRISLLQK